MNKTIGKYDCFIGDVLFRDHGYSDLPPRGTIGPVCWEWFDILCVHRGRVDLKMANAGQVELRKNDGLLILPRTRFEGVALRHGARISVQHFEIRDYPKSKLHVPDPIGWYAGRRHGTELFHYEDTHPLAVDIERAIDYSFQPESKTLHVMRVAQLILILGQIQTQSRLAPSVAGDDRVIKLQRRLDAIEKIQEITPSIMARWVGLSDSRFRVWFKEHYAMPPKTYLIRQRIGVAMRLLRETQLPIKVIAAELGYSDLPTFYHDFRKRTQTSPGIYRRSYTVRC